MRAVLYPVLALFVLASLPWVFPSGSAGAVLGLPGWAVYTLVVSLIYAGAVSFFVRRFWDAGETEEEVPAERD